MSRHHRRRRPESNAGTRLAAEIAWDRVRAMVDQGFFSCIFCGSRDCATAIAWNIDRDRRVRLGIPVDAPDWYAIALCPRCLDARNPSDPGVQSYIDETIRDHGWWIPFQDPLGPMRPLGS